LLFPATSASPLIETVHAFQGHTIYKFLSAIFLNIIIIIIIMTSSKLSLDYPPSLKAHLRALNFDQFPKHVVGFSFHYKLTKERIDVYYQTLDSQTGDGDDIDEWERWESFSDLEKQAFEINIEALKRQQQAMFREQQKGKQQQQKQQSPKKDVSGGGSGIAPVVVSPVAAVKHSSSSGATVKGKRKGAPNSSDAAAKKKKKKRRYSTTSKKWQWAVPYNKASGNGSDDDGSLSSQDDPLDDASDSDFEDDAKVKRGTKKGKNKVKKGRWGFQEHEDFVNAVQSYGNGRIDWEAISEDVFGGARSIKSLERRWLLLQQGKLPLSTKSSAKSNVSEKPKRTKTKNWTKEEDDLLSRYLDKIISKELNEEDIASLFPRRTEAAVFIRAWKMNRKLPKGTTEEQECQQVDKTKAEDDECSTSESTGSSQYSGTDTCLGGTDGDAMVVMEDITSFENPATKCEKHDVSLPSPRASSSTAIKFVDMLDSDDSDHESSMAGERKINAAVKSEP
jgi:Myb-like DNA-binding domain